MSEADNRVLVEQLYDALNAHDLDRLAKLYDDSYLLECDSFPAPIRGPEGAKRTTATYLTAFPDLQFEILQMIATGDHVVTRWRATGTNNGEFNGNPPTGRRVCINGCSVSEIRNGRMVKSVMYFDQLSLLRPLAGANEQAATAGS
ncbi:MAG TPA: ester cyclase [Candidatus Sulfotelmatobacter sp.]|nr:ester cyclase [Candidatus Sulfotelmatobacter sp.]